MTRSEFKNLLIRLNPQIEAALEHASLDLPRAAWDTAAFCFVHEKADDTDAGILKEQILFLQEHGYMNLEAG